MRSRVYLIAAIVGFFVPPTLITYYWIDRGSIDLIDTLNAMVDNTIALAVFMDITISSLVFLFWSYNESKERGIGGWGWLVPANVFIGLCFALPLFLYRREAAIESAATPGQ